MPSPTTAAPLSCPPLLLDAPAASSHIEAACGRPLAGLVKLREADWRLVPAGRVLAHLNAAPCTNVVGGVYAMARIAEPGAPDRPARMDASTWQLMVCRALEPFDRAGDVPASRLAECIGLPEDASALEALMRARYAGLRPEWDTVEGGAVVLCTFERVD